MRRRRFLEGLVGAVALALTACTSDLANQSQAPSSGGGSRPGGGSPPGGGTPGGGTHSGGTTSSHGGSGSPSGGHSDPTHRMFHAPQGIVQVPVPQGTITALPGHGNLVALTVDDGTDPEVLHAYLKLAARTGLRLTFFANGYMSSWTEYAPLLRPLVDQGQAIIANHTWSHVDLTGLSDKGIQYQVQNNEQFLNQTYGVSGRPFLRPPYGYHNDRVDQLLVELGYPAVTMWYGSLGDSTVITPQRLLAHAREWLLPEHLVIGHANHPAVLDVMDQIVDIIRDRHLQPVHLADVYAATQTGTSS